MATLGFESSKKDETAGLLWVGQFWHLVKPFQPLI